MPSWSCARPRAQLDDPVRYLLTDYQRYQPLLIHLCGSQSYYYGGDEVLRYGADLF